MVDVEPQVFTKAATALRAEISGITVSGVEDYAPAKLPFCSLVEADNYSYLPSRDTASNENHVNVMYEANIFSAKKGGKKTEAKAIEAVLDTVMNGMGFTKMSSTPINEGDGTRCRRVVRYAAVIGKNNVIYRR